MRRRPRLTKAERERRAAVARQKLLPAAIRATVRKGFYATVAGLERHRDKITDPARLAGWLRTRPEVIRVRGVPARKRRRIRTPSRRGRR